MTMIKYYNRQSAYKMYLTNAVLSRMYFIRILFAADIPKHRTCCPVKVLKIILYKCSVVSITLNVLIVSLKGGLCP